MPLNRLRFREKREQYGSREKLAGAIGTTGTTIRNWEVTDADPGLVLFEKAAKEMNTTVAFFLEEVDDPSPDALKILQRERPDIDLSEFKDHLPANVIERIIREPMRASIDQDAAALKTEEEVIDALRETERRIILYELRDELRKRRDELQKGEQQNT